MYSKFGPPKNNTNVPKFNLKNLRVKRQMEGLPKTFDLRNKKVGGHYIIGPIKTQGKIQTLRLDLKSFQ